MTRLLIASMLLVSVARADDKADAKFKEFKLVRQSRLSVVPVSNEHFKLLMKMSGTK